MQPADLRHSSTDTSLPDSRVITPNLQHGSYLTDNEGDAVDDIDGHSSEWSLSPSSESASTSAYDSWLSAPPTPEPRILSNGLALTPSHGDVKPIVYSRSRKFPDDRSFLQECPEGMLSLASGLTALPFAKHGRTSSPCHFTPPSERLAECQARLQTIQ